MEFGRPVVMSVAGLDPSAGAGLLADIKAFEQHKVYGLGIATAQTVQTENDFVSIRWESDEAIVSAIEHMLAHYKVTAVKIGIVQSISSLHKIVSAIHAYDAGVRIVVDPVICSSTEFNFWRDDIDESLLAELLQMLELITPNYKEAAQLVRGADGCQAAEKLSSYCNVLLKGGHNENEPGVDYLFQRSGMDKLAPGVGNIFSKHGSGCVLSAATTANLALGDSLVDACRRAKAYTESFLTSNSSLLGYHAG